MSVQYIEYHPYGGAKDLFLCRDPAVILCGPAGTGKSRACAEYLNYLCENYPGIRCAAIRKTRVSLSESWMVTFEDKVLTPDSPLLTGVGRLNRHSYEYPNGSTIVLGGMDNATRLYSTEFDVIYVQEVTELEQEEWEQLFRALRNGKLPYQQLLGDCNPQSPSHWIYQLWKEGGVKYIEVLHKDNPTLTAEYLEKLSTKIRTPHLRARLFEGRWVAAEGIIYDCWDAGKHVVDGYVDYSTVDHCWYIKTRHGEKVRLGGFAAGVDWGYTNPGVIVVGGVDQDGRVWIVKQIYQTNKNRNWWADRADELRQRFGVTRFFCDPAEPQSIDVFNERMGRAGGYWIAVQAENAIQTGIAVMRERINDGKFLVLKNSLEAPDQDRVADRLPTRLEQEITEYVYKKPKAGQVSTRVIKELPDPGCEDHGLDAARYLCFGLEGLDLRPEIKPEGGYAEGTWGNIMGHDQMDFRPFIKLPSGRSPYKTWRTR